MKIVNSGSRVLIYGDELKVSDKLENIVYKLCFNKMTGFFLEKHNDIEIKDNKIYGVHKKKAEKVMRTFAKFERNLGIMLSGDKGMGKSLFSKMLSLKSIESGYPVIIVEQYIPSIASFISSIDQEVMVMFDEFDKTFKEIDGHNPQDELLTLIDGFDNGKKMFVITCNETRKISDYFINRTGRFHYHFKFSYPTPIEVKEYLMDNLKEEFRDEIDAVVRFSTKVNLNYDSLRSIVFELNNGETFGATMEDLNILKEESEGISFKVDFMLNGKTINANSRHIDLFKETLAFSLYVDDNCYQFNIPAKEFTTNYSNGEIIAYNVKCVVEYCNDGNDVIENVDYIKLKKKSILENFKYSV